MRRWTTSTLPTLKRAVRRVPRSPLPESQRRMTQGLRVRRVSFIRRPRRHPGLHGQTSVVLRGKLKDDTASILDGLDPVWAYRSQDDAIAKLESRRSFLTSDLRRLGGRLR